ncbi:hypothetical protein [Haliangium ochraceum]|uniref:Lipoprotein n=1 Tax=Haliangium ochraceum (strain DSM 14365 / JCM 11303 / SMP-2) TaxID=502025 RepID=D0LUF7_HALO1|nr:hypothetical protein [Haliangium ochraceum]ACY19280.1 conserved hypothetical protein [Haliangium ochraceum DSM 14365]
MTRHPFPRLGLCAATLSLLVGITAACNTASADRSAAGTMVAPPDPGPYGLEILGEMGVPIETYYHRGRTYMLGYEGERYTVRITNPTPSRIEAVLSIDGLDAVDGEPADLRKRGYVIAPYGELRVEGFRVSSQHVAAFRFSSVGNSYAGRKGKARNIGVIGVAIFAEQGPPQMAYQPAPPPPRRYYGHRGEGARDRAEEDFDGAAELEAAPAAPSAGSMNRSAKRRAAPADDAAVGGMGSGRCCGPTPAPQHRPGLGTEFGERRYSAVSFTQFVRNHPVQPSAVLELRYNDAPGLRAMGIPLVRENEIVTRETATPFPGDPRFARPPGY